MRRSWHSVGQASRLSCGWNGERVLQLRLEPLPGGATFPRDRWMGSPRVPPVPGDNRGRLSYSSPANSDF